MCTIFHIHSNVEDVIVRGDLNFLNYGKWDRLTRVQMV